MESDKIIIEMVNSLIDRIGIVLEDKAKQSNFGSLEYLLKEVIKYREEQLFLKDNYLLIAPRWMGECNITQEEEAVLNNISKINLYAAKKYHGGWSKDCI